MSQTSLDIRQSQTRVLQDQIDSAAVTQMDSVLASINNELTPPGRLIAASTPSLVVTVGTGTVVNPNTSKNRLIPFISNTYVNFAGGTITFPSGTGTITVSPGVNLAITIGASQFMAITVQLDSTGNLNLSAGAAQASSALALAAASPGSSSFLSLGVIVIQTNGSSVIQSIANSALYQFGSGTGGSGGSGSGLGDDITSLQFQADIADLFPESPTASTTTINNASGFTNASYNAGKTMYAINYDASKTANTTGTAVTLSGTPGYTVVAGDVLVNRTTGEVKKITVVTTQTSYTIESAFATNLAAAGVTVSQAVHTKDVYNLSIDSNGNTLASNFTGSFSEIAVFYKDNSTAGSNQWANTAINCGYTASPDNSAWTTLQSKTIITSASKYGSAILPSAGTSLYIRFFANKTSGSGVVNLIMYKAYMQKLTSSAQGGILWSAYGTTNNSTTPVGCTVATTGGTTKITLTGGNQYAIGVNAGQTYGSVDVYLNGQMLPRFVAGSVPSGDSYYTEVSGTVIALDRDYSSVQLDVQVIQRTQIVDASTTNTTQLSALQSTMQQGFQGFASQGDFVITPTSTTGTPVAGTFYSSIVGRASMADLSQDVKPRFGIERIELQQIQQIQNEFGPNGENIWGTPNDLFGQVRLGGQWNAVPGSAGTGVNSNVVGDFIEITFYGTGLNMLAFTDNNARNWTASVDGGVASANLYVTGVSGFWQRNYSPNVAFVAASGLTLGVHTVKILINSAAFTNVEFYGFEIINTNATPANVSINSGISYVAGQKLVSSSQSLLAYNAPVTGTKGGRVLVYQKSDGTIAQSFQPTNAAQQNSTSADHTNEEIARTYWFREFGAGRADDFSQFVSGSGNRTFTLDDGTTTLITNGSDTNNEGIIPNTTNNYITLTFVGTGLDFVNVRGAVTASTFSFIVDGTTTASGLTGATFGANGTGLVKVVSGLPYGTHTFKFLCTTLSGAGVAIGRFIVYQPKTPALPSGAVQLGTYNVMGNYSPSASATVGTIAPGVLRKLASREMVYTGTWTALGLDPTNFSTGFGIDTTSATSFTQYVFFGTGVEWNGYVATGVNATVSIDGSTNISGFTNALYQAGTGVTWTPATGALGGTPSGAGQIRLAISGLTLGLHTIKILQNGTNPLYNDCMDVITPIHSYKSNIYADIQNTLPVGSNSVSDDRQTQPVKGLAAQKAWAQAVGISSSPTTTSTSPIPAADMSLAIKSNGGSLEISYCVEFTNSTGGGQIRLQLYVDGVVVGTQKNNSVSTATGPVLSSDSILVPASAGVHKVDLFWWVNTGTGTLSGTDRNIKVREV